MKTGIFIEPKQTYLRISNLVYFIVRSFLIPIKRIRLYLEHFLGVSQPAWPCSLISGDSVMCTWCASLLLFSRVNKGLEQWEIRLSTRVSNYFSRPCPLLYCSRVNCALCRAALAADFRSRWVERQIKANFLLSSSLLGIHRWTEQRPVFVKFIA